MVPKPLLNPDALITIEFELGEDLMALIERGLTLRELLREIRGQSKMSVRRLCDKAERELDKLLEHAVQ